MAVKYLDAKRIRGSSTGDPVTTKFLKLNSNSASNYRVSLDLQDKGGETVEDTWVIRFTRTITGGGASGGDDIGTHISYAMSNNDYTTGGTSGSQSVLGFKQGIGDGGAIAGSSTTMFPAPSNWGFANSGGADFTTVPNTYYFEIIRSGASGTGTLTAKVYTTSDYSGTPYGTASKDASSATVRYFSVANYNNGDTTGSIEAEIKDFKFWNDTNSTSGTPTYTATFNSGEWGENNNAKIGVSSATTSTDEKATLLTAAPTKSATFDGSNDKVTAGGTASTYGFLTGNGGSDWSLACWLKPTITHQDVFFDQCNGETAGIGVSFRFNVSGSEKRVQCGLSDGSTFSFFESGNVWTDGVWQHMCVTYDSSASTMTIYRNGVSAGSSSSVPSNNGTPTHAFTIGEAGAGNDNAYEGYISDLLLTDDILSSTEISALASGTAVSNVSPTIDNQELHYTFSENFNDSSGQSGRNGTASGTVIGTGGGTSPLNASSNLAENTLFEETDTYKTYWLQDGKWNESGALPATYMVLIGGSSTSDIQRITVATTGSAEDFGDLSPARANCAGCANETRALCAGGEPSGSSTEDINYITIATKSNSSDFGDLMAAEQRQGGLQAIDIDRGLFAGGLSDNTNIQYVTVSTTGDATDFGNLNTGSYYNGTAWSATRGLVCSGHNTNRIDYITMATTGNATDFGDLYEAKYSLAGITNLTRGIFCGGYETDTTGTVKRCDYVTIATPSNATQWGDCIAAGSGLQDHFSGGDLKTNGILAGGYDGVSTTNVIQTTTIATGSSFSDWGDLVQAKNAGASANGS